MENMGIAAARCEMKLTDSAIPAHSPSAVDTGPGALREFHICILDLCSLALRSPRLVEVPTTVCDLGGGVHVLPTVNTVSQI